MLSMQNIFVQRQVPIKVHQFTTQYPLLSMHNHVHSKVTYKSAQVDSMWESCDHFFNPEYTNAKILDEYMRL